MNAEDRSKLLDALLDGDISEADWIRIEAELSVDANVRREYYRRIQLDLLLEREALQREPNRETNGAFKSAGNASKGWTHRSWRTGRKALLVLVAIAAGLLLWLNTGDSANDRSGRTVASAATEEESASGFGILSGQSEAVWATDRVQEGDLLPSGQLHLASGRIHIELFSGVQLVIEGESIFSVDSAMQVTMRGGRARTHVPEPAVGFRIKTDSGDIVDLGTEFTVDVGQSGTDVQVVDGEVELRSGNNETRRVQVGDALRLSGNGSISQSSQREIPLMGPQQFQDLKAQQQAQRYLRWQQAAEDQQGDSRLVAYYQVNPEQPGLGQLNNLATKSSMLASDGAVVAAQPATDRWGRNAAALDFSRLGSRVRINVPGAHRGLTLLCWVKINSLDRWYNSLFLTDGHEEQEPHWQIMDDGRIFFSVKHAALSGQPAEKSQHVFYSPSIWNASLSGRWTMLAVTYDVDQQQVTHYLNGDPISRESIPTEALVTAIHMGAASIGNWGQPLYRTDPKFVLRNLNGSMDEFAIYSGALTTDEIQQLYRVGNPHDF